MKPIKPITPKQLTPDPDTPIVSAFEGLSSATLNTTIDPIWLDKLTNAYVDENKEIRKRCGSKVTNLISNVNHDVAFQIFRFVLDNENYVIVRNGTGLTLSGINYEGIYRSFVFKSQCFRLESLNETATFDLVADNNHGHVLIATPSSPLVSFCCLIRRGNVVSLSSDQKTIQFTIDGWPKNNSLSDLNCCIWSPTSFLHRPTSVTQNNNTITFTSASSFSWAEVGQTIKFHAFYWLRFADANYYPGSYLSFSAVRKNSVPLDVNVTVPPTLVDNPIINEPQSQPIDIPSLLVFKSNPPNAAAPLYTWKQNNLPLNSDEWAFSNGSYLITTPAQQTNPSPAFVAFGGLQTGNAPSSLLFCRLRKILLGNGLLVPISEMKIFVDKKQLSFPTFHDSNGTPISSGSASFFSTANYDPSLPGYRNPGTSADAIVELILSTPWRSSWSTSVVDLEPNPSDGSIEIGDSWIIPLYGYNSIADTINHSYPFIVKVVGNRLILAGRDNTVAFSHSDWSYRSISFNNLQVSTIEFNQASAFSIKLNCANVKGISSLNGVVFASSDKGIFQIKGSSSSQNPPSATDAQAAFFSLERPNSEGFCVFDNQLFFASESGLFALTFNDSTNNYETIKLSEHVSQFWLQQQPSSIVWSPSLRSILVNWASSSQLLALHVDSSSFYTIKVATSLPIWLNSTFDGFFVKSYTLPPNPSGVVVVCEWDRSLSRDFVDLPLLSDKFNVDLPGPSLLLSPTPTDCSPLTTPAEFISLFSPKAKQAPGYNHAQSTDGSSFLISELQGGMREFPIIASLVTKAFSGPKFDHSYQLRHFSLIVRGSGTLVARIVLCSPTYDDTLDELLSFSIGSPTNLGEGLLNAAFLPHPQPGSSSLIRLKAAGSAEAFQLALLFPDSASPDFAVAGIKFDTTSKQRKSKF
jgi:hypothetical protein